MTRKKITPWDLAGQAIKARVGDMRSINALYRMVDKYVAQEKFCPYCLTLVEGLVHRLDAEAAMRMISALFARMRELGYAYEGYSEGEPYFMNEEGNIV